MNDEKLDYKLHRLEKTRSTCLQAGNWAYLDSKGGLHKLTNDGYYFAWKCNMWTSSYWNNNTWCMGEIGSSKKQLIANIENEISKGHFIKWEDGFGKTKNSVLGV